MSRLNIFFVIAAIASIVGLPIAIYGGFFRGDSEGAVEVRITSTIPVTVSGDELAGAFGGRLAFTFDGVPIEGSVIEGLLVNHAGQSLSANDYEVPIGLIFQSGSILAVEPLERNPSDLSVELHTADSRTLVFSPAIFKDGESIRFRILVDDADAEPSVTGRIRLRGPILIQAVDTASDSKDSIKWWRAVLAGIAFAGIFVLASSIVETVLRKIRRHFSS